MTIEAAHKTVADIRNRVHPKCIVCSFANAKGLHLKFDAADDGSVKATFQCDETFEGYLGVLHGGVMGRWAIVCLRVVRLLLQLK